MLQVEINDIHHTLTGMRHKKLCFPEVVTIVIEGVMTKSQHEKILSKSVVSRTKMIKAIEWLKMNNPLYQKKGQILDPNSIPEPIIIDRAKTNNIESLNTNIELTEQICVVFPDAHLNEMTGGYKSVEEFKDIISKMNQGISAVTVHSKCSDFVYTN